MSMSRNRIAKILSCALTALGFTYFGFAADKNVDLDRSAANGAESTVSTSVVTSSPVKIRNKVTNRAVGQSFRFNWPSAGPGGFISEAGTPTRPGTTTGVGATWTWQTLQSVFSFTGSTCTNDICFTRTNPVGSSFGGFGVPGRSLTSSNITVSNASLTSSLLSFFSPEVEVFHVTSSIQQLAGGLFCYQTSVTNNTSDSITYQEAPAPAGCDSFCGDGIVQGVEECDGSNLNGTTCDDLGRTGDGLECLDCRFFPKGCLPATCGNNVREGFEACDGSDFGGGTCADYGGSGSLGCTSNCTVDLTSCSGLCGNGSVDTDGEQCDGSDLQGQTCGSFGGSGTLGCDFKCHLDFSGCSDVCGNGIRDDKEECEGSDLGGATCGNTTKFYSGTLACASDCTYDTSGCTCGNGIRDGADECDGTDFGGQTCGTFGGSGSLSCTSSCTVDLHGCSNVCGNGVRDGEEACEGSNLGGATCATVGGTGGTLGCTPSCAYDIHQCTGVCGNGVQEGAEECDGYDFGGETCGDGGSARPAADDEGRSSGRSESAGGAMTHAAVTPRRGFRDAVLPAGRSVPAADRRHRGELGIAGGGPESGTTAVAGFGIPNGQGYLVCDSQCRTDRSKCDFPCDSPGRTVTVPAGGTFTDKTTDVHPAKEVFSSATVCGSGVPDGGGNLCGGSDPSSKGTANLLVPDPTVSVLGHPFPVISSIVVQDGNDGVLQPGETASLFFNLTNAGNVGLANVHASLSYIAGDIDNDGTPDPITIVQSESDYPGPPCLAASQQGQADCDHPQPAPPACPNVVPFVVTVPSGHPIDVSRNFELFLTGNPVNPTVNAPESTTGVSYQGSINGNVGIGGFVCGNGILEPGEQCDDAGQSGCCSPTCTFATGPCSDGSKCTVGDACASGICTPGPRASCDDNNVCTNDDCSPTAPDDGCTHTNNTGPCPGGTCQGGTCVATSSQCPVAIVEADAMVKQASPTSTYGTKIEIEADDPPYENRTLLRIRIGGLGSGRSITGGSLRLFPMNSSSSGGRLRKAPCTWVESTVTWNTQPPLTGTPFVTKGAIVKNQPTSFDLAGGVAGDSDGTYCFLMDNAAGDADYASREASAGRPSVTLTTNPQCVPVTTEDKADATVANNQGTTNFGSATTLGVDGSPVKYVFFRFQVSGVNGRPVTSARLRLQTANISGSDSDKGGSIKLVPAASCGAWAENGITYANKPPTTGSTLSSVGSVKMGQIVEWDLKTSVPGDGTYCFRLESSSTNGADYNSKEGPPLKPELVLTLAP